MAQEAGLTPRKRPSQQRSRETVETILEAAAQVFVRDGYAHGTTNRIAERAGVSIGSLYQYFPNKDALLVALVDRHVEAGMRSVVDWVAGADPRSGSLEDLLREFVGEMMAFHGRRPELHRVLFEEAPHPPELHECVLGMEEALAHGWEALLRARPEIAVADPDTAAHFLVQTVETLTHRFVLHGLHDLDAESFTDEVVVLLLRYLTGARSLSEDSRSAGS